MVKDEVILSSCGEVALPPQCGLTMELKRRLCMPAPGQRRRGLRALLVDCALHRRGSFLPLTSQFSLLRDRLPANTHGAALTAVSSQISSSSFVSPSWSPPNETAGSKLCKCCYCRSFNYSLSWPFISSFFSLCCFTLLWFGSL